MLQRRPDLRGGARHDVRRLPGAGRPDLPLLKDRRDRFRRGRRPGRDALREASFFVERLAEEGCRSPAWSLNRVQRVAAPSLTSAQAAWPAAEQLADADDRSTTAATTGAAAAARRRWLGRRHGRSGWRRGSRPGTPASRWSRCRRSAQDIHDLDGLREVGAALTGRLSWPGRTRPTAAERDRVGRSGSGPEPWTQGRSGLGHGGLPVARCCESGALGRCWLRAASNRAAQEVTLGRRLSRARRSRSVMPPQTPNSVRLSRASARHSVMTGHRWQTTLARLLGSALDEQRVRVGLLAGPGWPSRPSNPC